MKRFVLTFLFLAPQSAQGMETVYSWLFADKSPEQVKIFHMSCQEELLLPRRLCKDCPKIYKED